MAQRQTARPDADDDDVAVEPVPSADESGHGLSAVGDAAAASAERVTTAYQSIANFAIGLLVSLIVLMVAILVGGEFASAVPTDNAFSTALNTTINTAGTAFELFGVVLIILPGVAAVALVSVLAANRGGMGGMGR